MFYFQECSKSFARLIHCFSGLQHCRNGVGCGREGDWASPSRRKAAGVSSKASRGLLSVRAVRVHRAAWSA